MFPGCNDPDLIKAVQGITAGEPMAGSLSPKANMTRMGCEGCLCCLTRATVSQIAEKVCSLLHKQLCSCRPVRVLMRTPVHYQECLQWAHEHQKCINGWAHLLPGKEMAPGCNMERCVKLWLWKPWELGIHLPKHFCRTSASRYSKGIS